MGNESDIYEHSDTDNAYDVLEQHQSKNKPRRPPHVGDLADLAQQQEERTAYLRVAQQSPGLGDSLSNNSGDEDSDRGCSATPPAARRPRNTVEPKGATSARNLSFYGPKYKDPITAAKNDMKRYIAIENPFPSRKHNFSKATEFLARRLQDSRDNGVNLVGELIGALDFTNPMLNHTAACFRL